MGDNPLRVSGGSRGITQRDRLPLVLRQRPWKVRIAGRYKIFVFDRSEAIVTQRRLIGDIDDDRLHRTFCQSVRYDRRKFRIGDQDLRFAVIEDKGNGVRVEPNVDWVDDRAARRYAK